MDARRVFHPGYVVVLRPFFLKNSTGGILSRRACPSELGGEVRR